MAVDRIEDLMRHDFAPQDVTRLAEQPHHRVPGAGGEKLDVRATHPARVYRLERWAVAEPMVRGLSAGANEIRNLGPTVNGTAAERTAPIAVSREDLSLIQDPAGRSGISPSA